MLRLSSLFFFFLTLLIKQTKITLSEAARTSQDLADEERPEWESHTLITARTEWLTNLCTLSFEVWQN